MDVGVTEDVWNQGTRTTGASERGSPDVFDGLAQAVRGGSFHSKDTTLLRDSAGGHGTMMLKDMSDNAWMFFMPAYKARTDPIR